MVSCRQEYSFHDHQNTIIDAFLLIPAWWFSPSLPKYDYFSLSVKLYWNWSCPSADDFPSVPPPPKVNLTKEDLDRHGITREPVILTRITITYADPGSAFLSKFRDNIKQYDIVAFTPTTDSALKQVRTPTHPKEGLILFFFFICPHLFSSPQDAHTESFSHSV